MKRARIAYGGAEHWATPVADDRSVRLDDGRIVPVDEIIWLPPVARGASIFALGLNYADHSAELGFKAPSEPLVFLKGYNSLVGHEGASRRPGEIEQMHPECELAVVIGKPACRVGRAEALNYVAGYTVANDYAIRDYLENYYRPNLRVKNRDRLTPIGPWLVDAAAVADPQKLTLETRVNGRIVQHGSTADMVFDVATLIEHLSGFMTLAPGDVILTGTPHGVAFVSPGDVVECEISGIGCLINHVCADVESGAA